MSTTTTTTTTAEKRLAQFLERVEAAGEAIEELFEARWKAIHQLKELAADAHDIWMEQGLSCATPAIFNPTTEVAGEVAEFLEESGGASSFTFELVASMMDDVNDLAAFAYKHAKEKLEQPAPTPGTATTSRVGSTGSPTTSTDSKMASVEKTAEELKEERTSYLRARFPRISPTPLPLGQLRGFEDPPGGPMTVFAPGAAALEAFWGLWVNPDPRLGYAVKLECGHPLPEPPPADRRDTLPLRVACVPCGVDVRLHVVEAF